MTRPPSESPGAARPTWAAGFFLTACLGAAAVAAPAAAARWGEASAAAAAGGVGLVLLLALIRLYSKHRAAVRSASSRAAEASQLAVRVREYSRELAHATAESEQLSSQLQQCVAELDQREDQRRADTSARAAAWEKAADIFIREALPRALRGSPVPSEMLEEAGLADSTVAGACAQMLAAVSDGVAELHQELAGQSESSRLAVVALARRVQASAHRIQEEATRMAQRHPADPDVLETSMRVDHAAAQQARHAQSMAVLSGEWPGQQWTEPLALVDVARAAAGRIVPYQRVTVSGDPDVAAAARVAEPLIHLVAELLANATQSSPPSSAVLVTVRTVQRGAVIEIDDGGVGMDEHRLEEARETASGRRQASLATLGEIPQTGLAVVGQYARRHGLSVDLVPSPYGGIRAVTLIPAELVEMLEPAGAAPARRAAAAPGPGTPALTGPGTPVLAGAPAAPARRGTAVPAGAGREAGQDPLTGQTAERAGAAAGGVSGTGLPQRRSRRGEGIHAASRMAEQPPATVPAPATGRLPTPAEVGAWMGAFLSAGVPAAAEPGAAGDSDRQHQQ
jgi:signal transduction histidine kinase